MKVHRRRTWQIVIVFLAISSQAVLVADALADEAKEQPRHAFAFVALNKVTRPSIEQIRAGLEAALPKGTNIENIETADNGVTFIVDGQVAFYAVLGFPIPWRDLELPCKTSLLWRDATRSLKQHKAHVIVTLVSDKGGQLERNVLLTKLLAAASQTYDAAGVYWGHGSVVISPSQITELAMEASVNDPPLIAWISFLAKKSSDGSISVATSGLDYFDCMEIEVVNAKRPFNDVMNAVMGVAYIMIKGEVIKNGDTIGSTGTEKIKTRHAISTRDKSKRVLRIDI